MPQFDFFSFFVQIYWFSIFSCIFYLVYLKLIVISSSRAIKMREKLNSSLFKMHLLPKNNFLYNACVLCFFKNY